MKRYMSVLALDARCTVYKLITLLVVSTVVQIWNFRRVLLETIQYYMENFGMEELAQIEENRLLITFERAIGDSYIQWMFCITMLLAAVVLIHACSEHGKVRTKQFLWRLRMERRQLFVVWFLYRVFWMIILVAWEIMVVIGLNEFYQQLIAKGKAPQALFMAFHRNAFLHNLMPLTDIRGIVKLFLLIVFLGMATAYIGYMGFEERRAACSILVTVTVYAVVLISAGADVLSLEWMLILVTAIAVISMIVSVVQSLGVHYDG